MLVEKISYYLEVERERYVLWLPVSLGSGIAFYFSLYSEPPAWVGIVCLAISTFLVAWRWQENHPFRFPLFLLFIFSFGFVLAQQRAIHVAAPKLKEPTGSVQIDGRIVVIEPQENGQRLIIARPHIRVENKNFKEITDLKYVRLRLSSDVEARQGQEIHVEANLFPPPVPIAPGAFDFSRQAWFLSVGAVGYALSPPELLDDNGAGWSEEALLWLARLRHKLSKRIVSSIEKGGLPEGIGWTAAALITAERGPVAPETLQAFRDAGLAHILVIAGMHLSMVAGLVYVGLRALMAAIPPLALRYNIKKITAAGALLITFGYLVISGAPIPTQRAFIMNGIILLSVLLDRKAISLRSISWAVFFVMVKEPEAILGASFQLSFSAVYGLVSAYEALGGKLLSVRKFLPGIFGRTLSHIAAILMTTQVAGTATAFYTIFHFNRYASYGLLGNLLAVPMVGVWVMPSALLAFLLLPFGLDHYGWILMGYGIRQVSVVAHWVSALPLASIDVAAMPVSSLLVFTFGGFWLCLWRQKWRWLGIVPMAIAIVIAVIHKPPDVMIDASGELIALRDDEGKLRLSSLYRSKIARDVWLRQAGQDKEVLLWDRRAGRYLSCDGDICLYGRNTHKVAIIHSSACQEAEIIVAPDVEYIECPPVMSVISKSSLEKYGTHAIRLSSDKINILTVAAWQGDRPWASYR